MLLQSRSLSRPIQPMELETLTKNFAPNLGCQSADTLNGVLSDIIDAGQSFFDSLVGKAKTGNVNAHIAAQNRAGADMNAVVNSYNTQKNNKTLTLGTIDASEAALRTIISNFHSFAIQVGTARALQGANDIAYYGGLAIADMEKDKTLFGVSPNPLNTGGGLINPPGGSILATMTPYLPFVLAGAFLFFMPKRR